MKKLILSIILIALPTLAGCASTTTDPASTKNSSDEAENISTSVTPDTQANYTARSGTSTVQFFDDEMNEIIKDANWYRLTSKATLRVEIDGDIPDQISIYITPTGTETADQRQQLAVVVVTDDSKTVDIALDFSDLSFSLGHLQVALEYGKTALFSDYYNVSFGEK
ncbi:MAG: hypothetical protein VB120_01435 [Lachnospiraceae bacterium]|nr:hypothetical protein [Lachnospiraceae bacterium]